MATRQIATEIVLGGEKEFNSAMTAINSNLKTLRTDMAATSAEFDGNADSIDALTAKQKILAETAAQNDAKVDALRQRYEHLKATLGEDAAATDKAKQALNQAIVAQQKAAKAAKENADALEAAQKAAREEAAAQEAANKSASAYTPVTQKAAGAAKTLGSSLKAFGSKVKDSATEVKAAAHHVPVLGEALDVVGAAGKVAKVGLHAAGTAAKAVGKVIPELQGKLTGMSMRIPAPDGSIVDLTVSLAKETTYEEVCAAMKAACEGDLKDVMAYEDQPIVSSDIIGETHSSIFDAQAGIALNGHFMKLCAWYDNEYGFTCNMMRLLAHIASVRGE